MSLINKNIKMFSYSYIHKLTEEIENISYNLNEDAMTTLYKNIEKYFNCIDGVCLFSESIEYQIDLKDIYLKALSRIIGKIKLEQPDLLIYCGVLHIMKPLRIINEEYISSITNKLLSKFANDFDENFSLRYLNNVFLFLELNGQDKITPNLIQLLFETLYMYKYKSEKISQNIGSLVDHLNRCRNISNDMDVNKILDIFKDCIGNNIILDEDGYIDILVKLMDTTKPYCKHELVYELFTPFLWENVLPKENMSLLTQQFYPTLTSYLKFLKDRNDTSDASKVCFILEKIKEHAIHRIKVGNDKTDFIYVFGLISSMSSSGFFTEDDVQDIESKILGLKLPEPEIIGTDAVFVYYVLLEVMFNSRLDVTRLFMNKILESPSILECIIRNFNERSIGSYFGKILIALCMDYGVEARLNRPLSKPFMSVGMFDVKKVDILNIAYFLDALINFDFSVFGSNPLENESVIGILKLLHELTSMDVVTRSEISELREMIEHPVIPLLKDAIQGKWSNIESKISLKEEVSEIQTNGQYAGVTA